MFENQIFHGLLILTLVLSTLVDQIYGIFFILKYSFNTYGGRDSNKGPICNSYYDYELWSHQPGLPADGQEQYCAADLGKWEAGATGDGTSIGSCQYGDYVGLGNTWAFCPTSYGGNLYLNGLHKVCVSAPSWTILASCPALECQGNNWVATIVCYDDTWYTG